MATNYQRGRAFEYRTRDKLLDMGAVYVMRAAQSKGKVDLLALWHGKWQSNGDAVPPIAKTGPPWIVQCKRDGRLPAAEKLALLEIAEQTGAIPILAKTERNGRGVLFQDLRAHLLGEEKS